MLLLIVEEVLDIVLVHLQVYSVESDRLHALNFQTVVVRKFVLKKLIFVQRVEALTFVYSHAHVMLLLA